MRTSQRGFILHKFKPGQFYNKNTELTEDSIGLGQDSFPAKQAIENPGFIYLLKNIFNYSHVTLNKPNPM